MFHRRILTALIVLVAFAATSSAFAGKAGTPPMAQKCVKKCTNLQPAPWYKVLAMYPANRVLDAMDIFRVSVSAGPGVGVNARTTNLVVAAGIGNYSTTNVGMRGRVLPAFENTVNECGVSVLGNISGNLQNDPSEIGLTVHGLVGVNVAVSVVEAVDFVTGLVMIDIQGDDLTPSPWD